MKEEIAQKLDQFFSNYKRTTYKKGEILLRAGDEPSRIFYLKKGYIRQYIISRKGDELVVNVFKPGAFFPLALVLTDTPNDYFFEATSETEAWVAPKQDVVDFIKKEPEILYDTLTRVFRGTEGVLKRMIYMMAGNAHTRLLIELIIYAKRFAPGEKENIPLTISEKELGAQAGMTRETVSREMRALKEKGLIISLNNSFVIKDLRTLEETLDELS